MISDVFHWYHSLLYSTCLLRVSQSLNVFLPRCCPWADSKPGGHGKHSLHVFTPLHWVPFPVNSSGQLMVCNLAPEQVKFLFIISEDRTIWECFRVGFAGIHYTLAWRWSLLDRFQNKFWWASITVFASRMVTKHDWMRSHPTPTLS